MVQKYVGEYTGHMSCVFFSIFGASATVKSSFRVDVILIMHGNAGNGREFWSAVSVVSASFFANFPAND